MRTVTISQLKNGLSAYLKRVRAGETVLVLDRQEPVAILERVNTADHPDSRLARLEHSGALRRPRRPLALEALGALKLPKARASVVEALLNERATGR